MTVVPNYRHYSHEPIVFDRSRSYVQMEPLAYRKPAGFWVSVAGEDDWSTWCRDNDFRLAALVYECTVLLRDEARILQIGDRDGLREFHQSYAVETDFERQHGGVFGHDGWPIDWRKVADDYQGIIISPYQWSLRSRGPQWYYPWDCASGCIWDTDAIDSVKD